MKIALVYNRDSRRVINLFGIPNPEKMGKATIMRISDALEKAGHRVEAIEGDKDLIKNLEEFMPTVVAGEIPGLVFNISYGIQGQSRYTHIPAILEMVGIPYLGSGPLAHSICLDKAITKIVLRQNNLPTPDFVMLDSVDYPEPDLEFPLIVKPNHEAVSFGVTLAKNSDELRKAVETLLERYREPVIAERYIEGREINVGLMGNSPVEAFPPCEILFGPNGQKIYSYEDKTGKSGRQISLGCPAELMPEQALEAKRLAVKAFRAVGCNDFARVDMRLGLDGRFQILEINSLPSMGEHSSYLRAAKAAGLENDNVFNRLVDVASARYFGTPTPPKVSITTDSYTPVFNFITGNRSDLEKAVAKWSRISSRTHDNAGILNVIKEASGLMTGFGMSAVPELTNKQNVWAWQTKAGYRNGTLLIAHVDVPLNEKAPRTSFRLEPEWMYGDGIAVSRGPLAVLEFSLRALHEINILKHRRLGVLLYADEGTEARHSASTIRRAAGASARVLVLRPGIANCTVTTRRSGLRLYLLSVEGKSNRLDEWVEEEDVLRWTSARLANFSSLSEPEKKLDIGVLKFKTTSFPLRLPHLAKADIMMSYSSTALADRKENEIRLELDTSHPFNCDFTRLADRPPMHHRRVNEELTAALKDVASKWKINLCEYSAVWPSVAGLVPAGVPVVCGLGPFSRHLYTPDEAINRLSLEERCLILAGLIAEKGAPNGKMHK